MSNQDNLFRDSDSEEEELVISWYNKHSDALSNAQRQNHTILLKRGLYEFGSVPDQDALVDYIANISPEKRIFHEMLPDKGCRMFADIDADGLSMSKAHMFLQFNELMKDVFQGLNMPFNPKRVKLLVSSGQKLSGHWSYLGASFKSMKHQKQFWKYVGHQIEKSYPDLCFNVSDGKIGLCHIIDLQVYRKTGSMRAVLCHKKGQDRTLYPSSLESSTSRVKKIKNYNLLEYLIFNPDADEWYDFSLPKQGQNMPQLLDSKFGDVDINQIVSEELQMKVVETRGAMIILKNVGTRVCVIGGEENKSDGGYLVVRRDGLHFYCHDDGCSKSKRIHSWDKSEEKISVFRDYKQFVNKETELGDIQDWMENTIVAIDNGGSRFLMTRSEIKYPVDNGNPRYPSFISWKTVNEKDILETLDKYTSIPNSKYDEVYAEKYSEMTRDERLEEQKAGRSSNAFETLFHNIRAFIVSSMRGNKMTNYNSAGFVPFLKRNGEPTLHDEFNTFTGFPMEKIPITIGTSFVNSLWYKHMGDELMNGDTGEAGHFSDFIADIIQDPAQIKGPSHLFHSEQGMGKSLMGDWLKLLIGDNLVYSFSNVDDYFSAFTGSSGSKLLKIFEEVSSKGNAFYKHDILKARQTAPDEVIKAKYLPDRIQRNSARHIYFTNNASALYIENSDRRNTMHQANNRYANNTDYFSSIVRELESEEMVRRAFEWYASRQYTRKSVYTAYDTNYKNDQKIKNLARPIKFIIELIESDFLTVSRADRQGNKFKARAVHDLFRDWCGGVGNSKFVSEFKTAIDKMAIKPSTPQKIHRKCVRSYVIDVDVVEKRLQTYLKLPDFTFDIIVQSDESSDSD